MNLFKPISPHQNDLPAGVDIQAVVNSDEPDAIRFEPFLNKDRTPITKKKMLPSDGNAFLVYSLAMFPLQVAKTLHPLRTSVMNGARMRWRGVPVRTRALTPAVAMSSLCSFVLKTVLSKRHLLSGAVVLCPINKKAFVATATNASYG